MKIPKPPAGRGALMLVAGLLVVLAGLWGYSGYMFVLSPSRGLNALAGPDENYYFLVAQFEQSALKSQNAILQYGSGRADLNEVSLRFQVLESKLQILEEPTDSTFALVQLPHYQESVGKLRDIVEGIAFDIDGLERDRSTAFDLAARYEAMRAPVQQLEMSVGDAESKRRDYLYTDYLYRRRALVKSSIGVLAVLAILVGLLVANARRVRALMAQQRAALDRETQAAQAATSAVNAKNAFLGMIGHELRTPLQSIMAATDVLVERKFERTDQLLIDQLARAANVLDAQMKDLTDFSRMEAGKLSLRRRVFKPQDVIAAAVESVSERAKRKGLTLILVQPDEEVANVSDPYRIQQVIVNLLVNAIKYTDEGTVTVRSRIDCAQFEDRLTVEIADTGPGMSEEEIALIFQPFVQLDSSSTRRHDGIGMGLAIVRGLLTLLSGTIKVDSQVGTGTVFTVTFPLERAVGTRHAEPVSATTSYRLGEKLVLAVDDHESMRESLSTMLTTLGVGYVLAASGDEALALLERRKFDAVLLDLSMPDKDGVTVAQALRQGQGPNRQVPVIACSAIAPELVPFGHRALFVRYLMKPIRADVLKSTLDEIFGEGL
jgi:signal transduction histidine kinase/ActR/RegA family two-component response regulator